MSSVTNTTGLNGLNPPIHYNYIWLIIGSTILLCILVWYVSVFLTTRRKPVKSLAMLPVLSPASTLGELKARYIQQIEERHQRYKNKEISFKELHDGLSVLVRYFVYEANHFPAPILTLGELKRTPYPKLAKLIAYFYPQEFALKESANSDASVEAAKGFIQEWV